MYGSYKNNVFVGCVALWHHGEDMSTNAASGTRNDRHSHEPATTLSRPVRIVALGAASVALLCWGSPPLALIAGILFALLIGHPFAHLNHKASKWLLQFCVVLLGFGMDLQVVLRLGAHGSLFAAVTIISTLLLGWWVGRRFGLDRNTSTLISSGTAICGGSAIAAVSTVIGATEAEIAVSIGTVFLLNALALYIFPFAGHLLGLSQAQFGLWAGVAIHDISSVVGAGLSYGQEALETATAVKLSRTLWIIPLTLAFAYGLGARHSESTGRTLAQPRRTSISIPWFIGLFLAASLLRSLFPFFTTWAPTISEVSHRGMILVLFLIGTSLSLRALKAVGWRTVATGITLWLFISIGSLLAITGLHLSS